MNIEERKAYIEKHKEQIIKQKKDMTIRFIELYKSINEYDEKIKNEIVLCEKRDIEDHLNSYTIEPAGDKEEVCGVDLKPYLEEIRHLEDHEEMIVLYIKDGKVIDKIKIVGDSCSIKTGTKVEEELIIKAKNLGADIYHCHNHPLYTYAILSKGDIGGYNRLVKKLAKKHNVKIADYAVVTEDDYCTLKEL